METKLRLMQMALDDRDEFLNHAEDLHRRQVEQVQETVNHERSEKAALQLRYNELQERINDRVLPPLRTTVVASDGDGSVKVRTRSPRWSDKAAELERDSRERYWKEVADRVKADELGPEGAVNVSSAPQGD